MFIIIIIIIISSSSSSSIMALQPIIRPWLLFQFLDPIHSR
jgi:hypothetical protein